MTPIQEEIIDVRPHRWRQLRCGRGPLALCLHGAGGSADSFAPLMRELANHFTLIAPDLPGHCGTRLGTPGRSGLQDMSEDICALMEYQGLQVDVTVGHSAGAAIALSADDRLSPRGHVLINAALSEFGGLAGWVFPAMAKGLSVTPFAAEMLARHLGNRDRLLGLLAATGSTIDDDIEDRYAALAANPEHIKGTLRMMASWKLQPCLARLPHINAPVLLIGGKSDGTVPISVSKRAKETLPNAKLVIHPGGHLLHEEAPAIVAGDILEFVGSLSDTKTQSG